MERGFNCVNIKTGRQTERGKRGEKRDERGGEEVEERKG